MFKNLLVAISLFIGATLNAQVEWSTPQRNLTLGDTLQVPMYVSNFINIAGFQYTINYDTTKLSLIGVELPSDNPLPMASLDEEYFVEVSDTLFYPSCITGDFGLCTKGSILLAWLKPQGSTVPDNTLAYTLHFRILGEDSLSNVVSFVDDPLYPIAYDVHLNQIPLHFSIQSALSNVTSLNISTAKVYPNPATNALSVTESGLLVIYNEYGQVVLTKELEANVPFVIDLSRGTYFYQLNKSFGKLIISK